MACSAKDTRLDNRTARLRLTKGRRYQVTLRDGVALCYRRTAQGYGVWTVRIENADGEEKMHRIGSADDYTEADGVNAFSYVQAQDQARDLAEHRPAPPYTVTEATEDYLAWFRDHRKSVETTNATIEAHIKPALGDDLSRLLLPKS